MSQQGTSTPGGATNANPMPGDSTKDTSRQHLAAEPAADQSIPGCALPGRPGVNDKRTPESAGEAPITGVAAPRDGQPD